MPPNPSAVEVLTEPEAPPEAPEQASECRADVPVLESSKGLVVAAHPLATAIGVAALEKGLSAMDAAGAVAIALTLVEPQSSGLGGGAFLLHHDAASKVTTAWDGRESAPLAATPDQFQTDGVARPWGDVVPGGLSTGTPGLLKMLEEAQKAHGRGSLADLVLPAAALAREGFEVSPRMAMSIRQIEERQDVLRKDAAATAYFYPEGDALEAGDRVINLALAETLETIARDGSAAFYGGVLGEHLVQAVQQSRFNPGRLTLEDLRRYRAVRRDPVCVPFRGRSVCGHPPPTSGGVTTLQILALLGEEPLPPVDSAAYLHQFTEAAGLAWADREAYLADPRVGVPTAALLEPAYLAGRRALIQTDASITAGPGLVEVPTGASDLCAEGQDTTHLVVVDAAGNVVSLTSSIENAFGSGVFVDGYLLNNQLTDFSRDAVGPLGDPLPNAVAACKRPRSSMAPILVLDGEGEVELALGSPGGSRIIQYVARVTADVLGQGLELQAAIERPHLVGLGSTIELESGCGRPELTSEQVQGLQALGHTTSTVELNSGLHGIQRTQNGFRSGIDPRREGAAGAPK